MFVHCRQLTPVRRDDLFMTSPVPLITRIPQVLSRVDPDLPVLTVGPIGEGTVPPVVIAPRQLRPGLANFLGIALQELLKVPQASDVREMVANAQAAVCRVLSLGHKSHIDELIESQYAAEAYSDLEQFFAALEALYNGTGRKPMRVVYALPTERGASTTHAYVHGDTVMITPYGMSCAAQRYEFTRERLQSALERLEMNTTVPEDVPPGTVALALPMTAWLRYVVKTPIRLARLYTPDVAASS
jgi:hypothetical protein